MPEPIDSAVKLDRQHGDSWSILLGVLRKTGPVSLSTREFGDATLKEGQGNAEIHLELNFDDHTVTARVIEE